MSGLVVSSRTQTIKVVGPGDSSFSSAIVVDSGPQGVAGSDGSEYVAALTDLEVEVNSFLEPESSISVLSDETVPGFVSFQRRAYLGTTTLTPVSNTTTETTLLSAPVALPANFFPDVSLGGDRLAVIDAAAYVNNTSGSAQNVSFDIEFVDLLFYWRTGNISFPNGGITPVRITAFTNMRGVIGNTVTGMVEARTSAAAVATASPSGTIFAIDVTDPTGLEFKTTMENADANLSVTPLFFGIRSMRKG